MTLSLASPDPKAWSLPAHLHAVLMFSIQHFKQHLRPSRLPIHSFMATAPVNLGEGSMTQVLTLEGVGTTGEAGKGTPVGFRPPLWPGPILQTMKQKHREVTSHA